MTYCYSITLLTRESHHLVLSQFARTKYQPLLPPLSNHSKVYLMYHSPSLQPVPSPSVTLVITPYYLKGKTKWTYPDTLLLILRAIVSNHSSPSTSYQSAFYQDLNDRSRFYHLQTSPSEPSLGWLAHLSSTEHRTEPSSPLSQATPPNNNAFHANPLITLPPPQQPSLSHHLHDLTTHATLQSSDGLIKLGLTKCRLAPNLTTIPNAPLILIGSRHIGTAPSARVHFESEIKNQLVQFRRFTGAFSVAAGWRERGYRAYASEEVGEGKGDEDGVAEGNGWSDTSGGGEGGGQFVTLSGWNNMEDYARFRKLMVMAANGRSWEELGRVSPDVVGETVVWGRRIA